MAACDKEGHARRPVSLATGLRDLRQLLASSNLASHRGEYKATQEYFNTFLLLVDSMTQKATQELTCSCRASLHHCAGASKIPCLGPGGER